MQVHLARSEIEDAVANYIELMFDERVEVIGIQIGGSGQKIVAEIELPDTVVGDSAVVIKPKKEED